MYGGGVVASSLCISVQVSGRGDCGVQRPVFLFCSIPVDPPDAVAQMDRAPSLQLATKAPSAPQWAHEIKLDGYCMAARIEGVRVKLLFWPRMDGEVSGDRSRVRQAQGEDGLSRW